MNGSNYVVEMVEEALHTWDTCNVYTEMRKWNVTFFFYTIFKLVKTAKK